MKFIRFCATDEVEKNGWINGELAGEIAGDVFGEFRRFEASYSLQKIRLLPPVLPGKIICVARNYEEHAIERQVEIPEYPMLFLKPPSSIIGPGEEIQIPPQSSQVEHEAELVVVIGKKGRWIRPGQARDYVFGYTIGNDVTARDLQMRDGQWTRGKGFDTFCPIGPWIETDLDVADILLSCRVNGELRQMASTKDMIFSIPQLITYISSIMTLYPGDLIFTGTPAGVGPLVDGDRVEVEIENLGLLTNPVKNA